MHLLSFRLNGDERSLAVEPRRTLLDALRDDLAPDRHQEGLRHGQLRRLHRAGRRPRDVRLPDCWRSTAPGREITTIEGLARRRRARSGPAGVHRGRRVSVRVLHTRPDHEPARPAQRQPEPDRGRDHARGDRQPLPLRRLPQHRQGRRSAPSSWQRRSAPTGGGAMHDRACKDRCEHHVASRRQGRGQPKIERPPSAAWEPGSRASASSASRCRGSRAWRR